MALEELNIKNNFELIESDNLFEEFKIRNTPAMIINNNIVLEGGNPSIKLVKDIIKKHLI